MGAQFRVTVKSEFADRILSGAEVINIQKQTNGFCEKTRASGNYEFRGVDTRVLAKGDSSVPESKLSFSAISSR